MSGPKARVKLELAALALGASAVATPALCAGPCASPAHMRLNAAFVRDMRAKDLRVLQLYAPGAVFINPDGPTVSGAAALRRLYRTVFATYDSDLTLEPKVVTGQVVGGAATGRLECVDEGAYEEDLRTRATDQTQHVTGRYRFTTEQVRGGRWRFTRMEWLK